MALNPFGSAPLVGILGPLPADPSQDQPTGLLSAPPAPQPTMGVLGVPGDPASLFGSPFNAAELAGTGPQAGADLDLFAAQMRALQTIRDQLGDPLGWFGPPAGQGDPASTATAGSTPAVPPLQPTMTAGGPAVGAAPTYTVQPGDNLSSIGGRYVATGLYPDVRTAVGALARANGLASSAILPGQALTIPTSASADDARLGGHLIAADAQAAAAGRPHLAANAGGPGLIQGLAVGAADGAASPWAAADSPHSGGPVFNLAGPATAGGMPPSALSPVGPALSPVPGASHSSSTNWLHRAGEGADLAGNLVDDTTDGLGEGALLAGGTKGAQYAGMIDKFGRFGTGLTLLGAGMKTVGDVNGNLHSPDLGTAAVHNFTPAIIDLGGAFAGGRIGTALGGPEGGIGGGFLGGIARPEAQNWWNSELMTLKLPGGPALVAQQLANMRAGAD